MRWGKFVLFFQAVVLLIIGLVFFSQLFELDKADIKEFKIEINRGGSILSESNSPVIIDIKQRYKVAAYVSVVIAILELLIIGRLVRD